MVDRTDIDALLIGALYGELTPADEARLTAHLESHPADRTALDNLTRTRAAVRDSRVLAFQREPPHAISALLLQEASRRAPRAATVDRSETASWFQRFVRSFMAHPAMAAAATLVLVITAAGTLYLRGTDQFAKPEPPQLAADRAETASAAAPTGATAPVTPAPAAAAPAVPAPEPEAHAGNAPGDSTGALAGSSSAGSDAYRARLEEAPAPPAADQGIAAKPRAAAAADSLGERDDLYARAPYEKKATGKGAGQDVALRKLGAAKESPARVAKAEAVRGIELRTPQLMPKDLKEDDKPVPSRRQSAGDGRAAAPGGGAPTTPPASAIPSQAPPPAAPPVAGPAAAPAFEPAPAQASLANEAKRPAKPSVNRASPPSAGNTASNAQQGAQNDRRLDKTANAVNADAAKQAQADDKSARDKALLEWARKQREQVISLVNLNRCRDAASAAVEIYNRAPDYFNANVATDRQIRPCLAYVNDQRERADRSRAAKNAADVQPAQVAPSRK